MRFNLIVLGTLLWVNLSVYAQQAGQAKEPAKDALSTPSPAALPAAPPAGQETPAMNYRYEARGRRDPFRSLDVTASVQAASAPIVRPPGLRGQLVSEINLVGIVRKKGDLMAMATGFRGKTFFIRSHDELYDGKVVEIRSDAVVINQYLTDARGTKISQQIVKKLYPTRGEGKDAK